MHSEPSVLLHCNSLFLPQGGHKPGKPGILRDFSWLLREFFLLLCGHPVLLLNSLAHINEGDPTKSIKALKDGTELYLRLLICVFSAFCRRKLLRRKQRRLLSHLSSIADIHRAYVLLSRQRQSQCISAETWWKDLPYNSVSVPGITSFPPLMNWFIVSCSKCYSMIPYKNETVRTRCRRRALWSLCLSLLCLWLSQCSTVVRNTVVRAVWKWIGKPRFWTPVAP